jgi:thiamine biosynthesis lipoprotein
MASSSTPSSAASSSAASSSAGSSSAASSSPASSSAASSSAASSSQGSAENLRRSRTLGPVVLDALLWARTDEDAESAADAALDEAARVVALLDSTSTASPLWRLNAAAGKEPVVVGAEVFEVLLSLRRVAQLSRGAYDLTASVIDDTWGFTTSSGVPSTPHLPVRRELDRARQFVSADDLVLDPVLGTALLKKSGARVDVGNVLAAYALDRARATLVARGITDFVVSAGGDVIVSGRRGDRPWKVGVQDPRGPEPFLALPVDTDLLGGAVMTASDNESFFVVGDTRYHSILDARTGLPGTRCRSVTVFYKDALVAEALARAVFVLGAGDGVQLVGRVEGAEAVVVTADNRVVFSRRLAGMAAARSLQQRPPTDAP